MKRVADGDMGSPQKRPRGGEDVVEVRLLIPSKAAGSVIGKGGHNITKLRTEYKATITVPDCPGPERILTVAANAEIVLQVVEEVIPCLEDVPNRMSRTKEVDLRLMVHQSQAGCIIGKSGFKIKELREKTGAKIKIYTSCCPQSSDRVVQITGSQRTCIDCLREIIELVRNSPIKGVSSPYDPYNYDDYYSNEYGGFGDPNAKNVRGGGPPMRGSMGGPPPPMSGRSGRFGLGGGVGPGGGGPSSLGGLGGLSGRGGLRGGLSEDWGEHLRDYISPSTSDFSSLSSGPLGGRNLPPRGSFGGSGGSGGSGGGRSPFGGGRGGANGMIALSLVGPGNSSSQSMLGGKNSTQVTIPKDLAGAIIGKGGARIRKIRSDSGAGITIEEPLPGSNDRVITITGTSNQIQMAQYLLQQSVHPLTESSRTHDWSVRENSGRRY